MALIVEKPVKYLFIVLSFLIFMYGTQTLIMFTDAQIKNSEYIAENPDISNSGSVNLSDISNSSIVGEDITQEGNSEDITGGFFGFINSLFSWLTFQTVEGTPGFISFFLTIVSLSLWVVLILLIINMVTHWIPFIG